MGQRSPDVETFWRAFRAESGVTHDATDAVAFGDSPAQNDQLLGLALNTKGRQAGDRQPDATLHGGDIAELTLRPDQPAKA